MGCLIVLGVLFVVVLPIGLVAAWRKGTYDGENKPLPR